jgi:hypothetical protein
LIPAEPPNASQPTNNEKTKSNRPVSAPTYRKTLGRASVSSSVSTTSDVIYEAPTSIPPPKPKLKKSPSMSNMTLDKSFPVPGTKTNQEKA